MLNPFRSRGVAELDEVGEPTVVALGSDAATATMITVPPGQCFLIQRLVGQNLVDSLTTRDSSPVLVTPAISGSLGGYDGIGFYDVAGTLQSAALFRPFVRDNTVFIGISPNFRNALPQSAVNWKFKWPICVPAGWTVKSTGASGVGGNWAAYGQLVSDSTARQLGYSVSPSATDANRMSGVDSIITFSTTQIIVPARTDYSIQILDIHMRVQPVAAVITDGKMTVEQGDGRPIFVVANDIPGELREVYLSPGLYLKPGQSLNAKSSTALIGEVVVSWRYVPTNEVPSDHWWACVEPGLPTPATESVGLAEIGRRQQEQVVCFYPRLDTTKTTATTGFQHILRGYLVSIQKEPWADSASGLDTTDVFIVQITASNFGAVTGFSTLHSIVNTGNPLAPAISANHHDQCVLIGVDDIMMPGLKDTGSLWIVSTAFGLLTLSTPQSNADVDEFWVTLWGNTIPTKYGDPANRGSA